MAPLTIGPLAHLTGISVETIRFYERRGLLTRPPRPARGFRVYPEDSVARVCFIRQAQAIGFTLQEIGELLALQVTPGVDCGAVRERAIEKLELVEVRSAELARIRAALKGLIAACPGSGEIATCTILEALAGTNESVPTVVARKRTRT